MAGNLWCSRDSDKDAFSGSVITMSTPIYLYKIVPPSTPPPIPLPERLPVSELDSSDGFLHLSTAVQIPETLKRFFADAKMVYILRIEYKIVEKDTKWQYPTGGQYF